MTKITAKTKLKWYQQPKWAAGLIPVSLLGSYIMASLALNSASLLQYFAAILLLGLAVNRAAHLVFMALGKGRIG